MRQAPAGNTLSRLVCPGLALLVGAGLAALLSAWVFKSEVVYRSADLASNSLPVAAFFLLLVLLFARPLLRRLGLAFSDQALLLVYAMSATTVGLASLGFVESLLIQLPAPFWRTNATSPWNEFIDYLPRWVVPHSRRLLRGFYLQGDFWRRDTFLAWLPSLLFWGAFLLCLALAMLSAAWLLRDRFIRRERLTFPLAVVPFDLVRSDTGLLRNRLFWLGFGIAFGVQTLNALHHEFPAVPGLRVLPLDLSPWLAIPPWNAARPFWIAFYPLGIGLAYLMPLEVAFSCWVWHLVVKLEHVGSASLGLVGGGWPFQGWQAYGALATFAVIALWPRREPAAPRTRADKFAWAGLGLSLAALLTFAHFLGLRLHWALALAGVYALFSVAVVKLRAQTGCVWNPGVDLERLIMLPVGFSRLPRKQLVAFALLRWFTYGDWRGSPLPTQLEAFKIADSARLSPKLMASALAFALPFALAAALLTGVATYYHYGADTALVDQWRTGRGDLPWHELVAWLNNPSPAPWPRLGAFGFGAALTLLLAFLQRNFLRWPLAPAGYALAATGVLEWFWFPIFLAWAVKALLLRLGGMKTYRAALPFFLGLVAGDYFLCGSLAVLSWFAHHTLYKAFPI